MDHFHSLLNDIGLTSTETVIYLAGLSRASVDVQELVKQTQIKRPTVYHALETLIQKGLASKHGTARKLMFSMTPPDRIGRIIDEDIEKLELRKRHLDELVPLLKQRLPLAESNEVRVAQYEGIEGIKAVVEEALYCRSRKWDILAPRKNFFSEFDKAYSRYYLDTRNHRKIVARSLWERGTAEQDRPLTPSEVHERNPRYLPEVMHDRFEPVLILFDQKVAIISSVRAMSAILIDSTEIYRLMSAVFEGLWSMSEPYAPPSV